MQELVFLNGRFISKDRVKISALEPGFLYGWGLFETMRAYDNNIVYFDTHLDRLRKSCRLIDIRCPYSLDRLKTIILKVIKINDFLDAYVKLVLWKKEKGTDILISVKKYIPYSLSDYKRGFSACIFSHRQSESQFLAQLKTTNYLFYQLAHKEAKRRVFDEALILNNRGYVCEGSRSNIFLVKDNTLFTPALGSGCLDGITRKVVFDLAKRYNIPFYEANITSCDLYVADEAFLTNSLMGIMPLTSLEGRNIGLNRCAKLTEFLLKKYNCLLR